MLGKPIINNFSTEQLVVALIKISNDGFKSVEELNKTHSKAKEGHTLEQLTRIKTLFIVLNLKICRPDILISQFL